MIIYPTADESCSHERLRKQPLIRDDLQSRDGKGAVTQMVFSTLLWESFSQNHPFIDGNKRVGITVTAAFLRVNRYRLDFDDVAAFSFLIALYETRRMRFDELDAWLRLHVISQ